jgi:hypothetical protein
VPLAVQIGASDHLEEDLDVFPECGIDCITLDGAEGGADGGPGGPGPRRGHPRWGGGAGARPRCRAAHRLNASRSRW